jgi:hypothetical protein
MWSQLNEMDYLILALTKTLTHLLVLLVVLVVGLLPLMVVGQLLESSAPHRKVFVLRTK